MSEQSDPPRDRQHGVAAGDRRPLGEPPPPSDPAASTGSSRQVARVRSRIGRSGPFLGGVVATFLALVAYGLINPAPRPLTVADVNEAVGSALASQTPAPPRSELVYAAIQPSLVFITVDEPAGAPAARGVGTGVVVNDTAEVLTALHVVNGATAIHLTFADGSTSEATISVRQPDHDIAVLQPASPPASTVAATLGNPAVMQIGSEAYVVGNPFGLYGSLSTGVVSGLDRSYQAVDGGPEFKGLIQVDAAVNPGNSGGPLLDRNGRVVGIVTALVNPTRQDVFIGIGLAVPIDVAGGAAGLPPY
jgi:S1-C subfamily serine protease